MSETDMYSVLPRLLWFFKGVVGAGQALEQGGGRNVGMTSLLLLLL